MNKVSFEPSGAASDRKAIDWEKVLSKPNDDPPSERIISLLKIISATIAYCTLIGSGIDFIILYTRLGALVPLLIMIVSATAIVAMYLTFGRRSVQQRLFYVALLLLAGSTLTFVVVRFSHSEDGGFIANQIADNVYLNEVFESLKSGQEGTNERIEDVAVNVNDLVTGRAAVTEARRRISDSGLQENLEGLYQAIASGDPSTSMFATVGIVPSLSQLKNIIIRSGADPGALRNALRFVTNEAVGAVKSEITYDLLGLPPQMNSGELNKIRQAACAGINRELLWTSQIFVHECEDEYSWYQYQMLRYTPILEFLGFSVEGVYMRFASTEAPQYFSDAVASTEGISTYSVLFQPRRDANGGIKLYSKDFLEGLKIRHALPFSDNCAKAAAYGGFCSAVATVFVDNVREMRILSLSQQVALNPISNIERAIRNAAGGLAWTAIPGALTDSRFMSLEMYDQEIGLAVRVECAEDPRVAPIIFAALGSSPDSAADQIFGDVALAPSVTESAFEVDFPELSVSIKRKMFVPDVRMVRTELPVGFLDLMSQSTQMLMRVGAHNAIVDLTGFASALASIDHYSC